MAYEDIVNALSPAAPIPKKKGILSKILEALPDVAASFAEGYGSGAGTGQAGNFGEAAAARGLSSGYNRGKAINQENRIKESLNALKSTPEYASFTADEKAYYDVQPTEMLKAIQERRKSTEAAKAKNTDDFMTPQETSDFGAMIGKKFPEGHTIRRKNADLILKAMGVQNKQEQAANKPTVAQDAVDRNFAKDYADYVSGGGSADVANQLASLEGVSKELLSGNKNLTGPVISIQPDAMRKRLSPDSMSAQQTVEQSVQRTLKKILGGQFTEKEGMLFMQRGYDPALPEEDNALKLQRATRQLRLMAEAKQRAVEYYEANGTLKGFKGTIYTVSNGEVIPASPGEAESIVRSDAQPSASAPTQVGRFKIKEKGQ